MSRKIFQWTLAIVVSATAAHLEAGNMLVRVDLQAPLNNWGSPTTAEPLATAQSASFGSDGVNYWNPAPFQGVFSAPNGPYNLKRSSDLLGPTGTTVAVFTVNTNVVGMTSGKVGTVDSLRNDFYQVTTSTPVEWNISGLVPGAPYEMVLYAGQPAFVPPAVFGALFHLDADGQNSNLELSQVVNYSDGAYYFPSIVADATGMIHGDFGEAPNQFPGTGSWSGFQLAGPSVPEPATMVTIGVAMIATLVRRQR